ncbi:hypothetical protein GCM10011391_18630 [Pullulanibacillus camelliae]|uniref:Uncharacterized protein n=1 Tax=Pullulanibacillus camelliae TaxID=1707096 RepID=A0A8J2VWN8_9BACL|nr:hypothetical protein [Pullulanibacillus camelliae]GGE40125.1 hypothetical protein GCM10011391_18630 [Pullulanibacillus camelliae]
MSSSIIETENVVMVFIEFEQALSDLTIDTTLPIFRRLNKLFFNTLGDMIQGWCSILNPTL